MNIEKFPLAASEINCLFKKWFTFTRQVADHALAFGTTNFLVKFLSFFPEKPVKQASICNSQETGIGWIANLKRWLDLSIFYSFKKIVKLRLHTICYYSCQIDLLMKRISILEIYKWLILCVRKIFIIQWMNDKGSKDECLDDYLNYLLPPF